MHLFWTLHSLTGQGSIRESFIKICNSLSEAFLATRREKTWHSSLLWWQSLCQDLIIHWLEIQSIQSSLRRSLWTSKHSPVWKSTEIRLMSCLLPAMDPLVRQKDLGQLTFQASQCGHSMALRQQLLSFRVYWRELAPKIPCVRKCTWKNVTRYDLADYHTVLWRL